MKKIFLILSLCAATLVSGCNENALEIKNPNALTTADYWLSETDVQMGVNAAYAVFYITGSWQRYLHWRLDLMSDEGFSMSPMIATGDWTRFIYTDYNQLENNRHVWREAYRQIFRANQVLTFAPDVEGIDKSNLDKYMGQAYFLRGYNMFHLAIFWEEVPIITTLQGPADRPEQGTMAELWAQVESDMNKAIELLPVQWTGADVGRITQGAARAQLARALMQQHKWSEAATQLEWLISGAGSQYYDLMEDFSDNFKSSTENNKESVFEIQMSDQFTGNWDGNDSKGASNGHQRTIIFGLQNVGFRDGLARPWALDLFKQEKTVDGKLDPRLRMTLLYDDHTTDWADHPDETGLFYGKTWEGGGWKKTNPELYYRKYSRDMYPGRTTEDRYCEINFRVIRFADILLMYAECLNELDRTAAAYQYVDRVRARAGMAPLATAYPEIGNDKVKFLERLKWERVLELHGECVRWFDLKRWEEWKTPEGLASLRARDADYNNFEVGRHHRQPIPTEEINANANLEQITPY